MSIEFSKLTKLHDAFQPLVTPEGDKEMLQSIRDWTVGNATKESVIERGTNAERFVEAVCDAPSEELLARQKAAAQRFCTVKIEEIEAEEKTRQCGYFLALGAGETAPSPRQSTTIPDTKRVPDLDIAELHKQLLESETINDVPMDHIVEVACRAAELFRNERNIVTVDAPCVVVGDIHGQFHDLKHNILKNGGAFGESRFLFLGDYVDRGDESILCVALLLTAKILHPDHVFMIRGNHESRQTNCIYGFLAECKTRFPQNNGQSTNDAHDPFQMVNGEHPIWTQFNEVFDALPVAAIVGGKIFCIHGGLSPSAESLEQVLAVKRHTDIDDGVLADLTWSDPTGTQGYHFNSRGTGHLFGEDVTKRFIENNGLELICRAHQCVRSGFQFDHGDSLLTVFSAPNYCNQGNEGAIMKVATDGSREFVQFSAAPRKENPDGSLILPGGLPMYFQR